LQTPASHKNQIRRTKTEGTDSDVGSWLVDIVVKKGSENNVRRRFTLT